MRLFFAIVLTTLSASAADLLIAAAADLSPYEAQLSQSIERSLGIRARFSFGSSVNLAHQISQGAPFDVFLSADEEQVRTGLREGWLLKGSERQYATGRIALWSAKASIKDVEQLTDRSIRHIAIANPKFAPYGKAAREALERSGVWPKVADRIVYGENVRQTYIYAERGSADAAIVSWSLVRDRGGVLVPEKLHDPIRQWGAVVAGSGRAAEGRRVLEEVERSLRSR